ncbi:MAG TPA: hypothetical protein VKH64_01125 [Candidatus Binatia bacterium]|nr:hypothetical protein [Candidatus Binatia bacterium]
MRNYLSAALLIFIAACSEPITHNEELAAKQAEEFAEIALVKQNFERAYEQMSGKARSYLPLENFKETMIASHRDGYPKAIKATGVRPVKDAETIYVFLRGNDGAGKVFEYQVMLNGSEKSGYQVSTIRRLS